MNMILTLATGDGYNGSDSICGGHFVSKLGIDGCLDGRRVHVVEMGELREEIIWRE